MGIRIQAREIEILAGNPFENDLLGREATAEILTRLVRNIDGPCTMAVDGAWGSGKTTFLAMWARHLRDLHFPVVEFNAWETDFTSDPFVALSSEITDGLKGWTEQTIKDRVTDTTRVAKEVLRWVAPGALRLAGGVIPIVGAELGNAASNYAQELLTDYPKARQSVLDFRAELERLAGAVWASAEQKPLVVFVDELDRCRPSYAIELLELGKHIFSVDHAVFVLGVNKAELAHSVKALYGQSFGAESYLRRFFDIDFRLSAPDRRQFIQHMLDSGGYQEYLNRTRDGFALRNGGEVLTVLQNFLGGSEISLRDIAQAIHRFGVVLSSLSDEERGFSQTLAVLTVLSSVDPSLYRTLVSGEMTDQEIVGEFFSKPGFQSLRYTMPGKIVEAVIVAARITSRDILHRREDLPTKAPLFWHYEQLSGSVTSPSPEAEEEWRHAMTVDDLVRNFHNTRSDGTEFLGFDETVQRLELLSPDLMGGEQPQ